ncbi:MAG: T9SS type A sorting domain-containing protein, partial [Caldithrix sp.]
QWLAGDANAILGENFTTIPLIDNTTSVGDPSAEIPNEFTLSQNYPNPFNPSTTIEYTLPEAADVKLEILNSRGQRVSLLLNERQNKGRHQLTWNANGHSSGTYFYKIKAGSFRETRRMTLMK